MMLLSSEKLILTGEDAVSGSIVTANDNTMTWDYALANSNAISQ